VETPGTAAEASSQSTAATTRPAARMHSIWARSLRAIRPGAARSTAPYFLSSTRRVAARIPSVVPTPSTSESRPFSR